MSKVIYIYPQANRHRIFLTFFGGVLLLLCIALSPFFWHSAKLIIMFISLAAFIVFLTGISKCLEPNYSFYLTPNVLRYNHRCGQWQLNWQDIQLLHVLRYTIGIEQQDLPYIGIRVKNVQLLANAITPRLANKLLHEQKGLLIWCVQHELLSVEEISLKFLPYRGNNSIIKGPIAEFLYQSEALAKALGCHLVIPTTALDREPEAFCQLLKQCKQSAKHYPQVE